MGHWIEAEKIYRSLEPTSTELKLEKLLALFLVYKKTEQTNKAMEIIKSVLSIDCSYKQFSITAKDYFEATSHYSEAVDLSAAEYGRTKNPYWTQIINGYIESGIAKQVKPEHFIPLLSQFVNEEALYVIAISFPCGDAIQMENIIWSGWVV